MSLSNRALFLAVLIALAQLGARSAGSWYTSQPALPPEQNLADLPMELGDWYGVEAPLSKELLEEIDAASVMNRAYRNKLGETIEAHAAAFTDYVIGPPHFPPSCYHGSGWKQQSVRVVPLERDDGEAMPIAIYLFERDGIEAMVAFAMRADNETFITDQDLRRLQLRVRRKAGRLPLLKKAMLHTIVDTPQRAEQRLLSLARPLFEAIDAFK
ncbi:MAG: exosortase-associated EpsI family protein [Pirellulales bacterium]